MIDVLFFFALLIKHSFADLAMQGRLEPKYGGDKLNLRSPRLWIHCLDHAVLTFFVALIFLGIGKALVFAIVDFVLHFAIDYGKTWYTKHKKISRSSRIFWTIQSIDQMAHYTTYFILVLAM